MRKFWFLFLIFFAITVNAQQLHWMQTAINLGTFQEEAGKQEAVFKFVNIGSDPVMINNVRTSCGCTAADYPKNDIVPGDTAVIVVTYDPLGMMGRFEKTVKVYVGKDNYLTTLYISGKVLTCGKLMESKYPYKLGPLYLNCDSVWFGDIEQGSTHNRYIHAYNSSSDTLNISWINNAKGLSISSSSTEVEPGDLVTLNLYYNSIWAIEPGPDLMQFTLLADNSGSTDYRMNIPVGANIVPVNDNLSPDKIAHSPHIIYPTSLIDLGKLKKDKSVNVKFKISNSGKEPLELYRIYATDLGAACSLCPIKNFRINKFPKYIKPGKTVELKGKLWLDELTMLGRNAFNLMIEIKSNDPRNIRNQGNIHIVGQIIE